MNSRCQARILTLLVVLLIGSIINLSWDLSTLKDYVKTSIPSPAPLDRLGPPPAEHQGNIPSENDRGSTPLQTQNSNPVPPVIPKHQEGGEAKTEPTATVRKETSIIADKNVATKDKHEEDRAPSNDNEVIILNQNGEKLFQSNVIKPIVGTHKADVLNNVRANEEEVLPAETIHKQLNEMLTRYSAIKSENKASISDDGLPDISEDYDHQDPTAWLLNNTNVIVNPSTSDDILPAYFNTSAPDMTIQYEKYNDLTRTIIDRRSAHIKEQCRTKKMHLTKETKFYYYFPKMGATWCPVFKAASTNWKQVFCKAFKPNVFYARLKVLEEPFCHIGELSGFKIQSAKDQAEWRSGVQSSVTFTTARHPYERLISVYNNKFKNCEADMFTDWMMLSILRQFREVDNSISSIQRAQYIGAARRECHKPVSQRKLDPRNPYMTPLGVTFKEFIQSITTEFHIHKKPDFHWMPITVSCDFCILEYDVVEKFETLERDHYYILKLIGEKRRYPEIVGSHLNASGNTKQQLEAYFATLDERLLWTLYEMYKDDLDLFGYKPHFRVKNNPYK